MGYLGRLYHAIDLSTALIPYHFIKSGRAFTPLRVALMVTHRCNLRCAMCMIVERDAEFREKDLSTHELKLIIHKIPERTLITFTGGEPFVRKDLIDLMMFASKNHRINMITNGVLLNDEKISQLFALAPRRVFQKGLILVGVSVQGIGETHDKVVQVKGAFGKVRANLEKFREERKRWGKSLPLLDVKSVITDENVEEMDKLVDLAEEMEADFCTFQIVNTQDSSYGIEDAPEEAYMTPPPPVRFTKIDVLKTQLAEIEKRRKKVPFEIRFNPILPPEEIVRRYRNAIHIEDYGCYVPWSTAHIGPTGNLFPCYSINCGNLLEKSFDEAWNGATFREFRRKLRDAKIFPGCEGCCFISYRGKKGK